MASKNKAATVLFRAAQKAARQIDAAFGGLNFRMPLDTTAWQTAAHEWSTPTDGLSPHLCRPCSCMWPISMHTLRKINLN